MSKETNSQLTDEFKKDIRENGGKKNILGTLLALIAVILVFGTIGVAGYELIFKPEKVQHKSAEEKIESKPTQTNETPTTETTTPAATTTPTPATTTTPTTTATSTDYTVASGDTWSSIANANNMSSADLMKYNSATSEDLQIGQVIKIPKS